MNDYKSLDRNSLIIKLYHMITGRDDDIPIAAPREVLEKFGGHVTIEEYRNCNKTFITKEYRLLLPPMINLISCVEEKTKDNSSNIAKRFPEIKKSVIDNNMISGNKKNDEDKKFDIMETVGIKEILKKKNVFRK